MPAGAAPRAGPFFVPNHLLLLRQGRSSRYVRLVTPDSI